MTSFIVFDIDGTLSDPSHRLPLILEPPKRWKEFHALCGDDPPIPEIVSLCHAVRSWGFRVEFWTGRPEGNREVTLQWLQTHISPGITGGQLKMRGWGDFRPDYEVKLDWLNRCHQPPDLIVEDRLQVIQAYRARGIRVLQVAEGDY